MPAIAALLLALLERVPRIRFRPAPLLRPRLATDAFYLLTGFVALGTAGAVGVRAATEWVDARTGLGHAVWAAVPAPVGVLAALVLLDLGNYAAHWALHRWDVLWEFHRAHHSSTRLDWMATFRSHLVEQLLRRAVAPLGLVALGVPAPTVGAAAGVFVAWAMLNHANVRLPLAVLERLLVTPRLHRLHHLPATTERNLGTVFTCWDRLRGTLVMDDPPADAVFGLPRRAGSYPEDWLGQLLAPWRHGATSR